MAKHGSIAAGFVHVPYNWAYADAAARTGATGLVTADEGKLARQLDDNSLWMLTDAAAPTWLAVGQSAAGPQWVATPATLSSAGVAGQIAYDGLYFYVCVATNTWGKALLATS